MGTVRDALELGARALPRRDGIPDPRREATWLLAHAWGVEETWLYLYPEAEVPTAAGERYQLWLRRRVLGAPAHHLTGECPFWGRQLVVSPAALVPRPETELLVEAALGLQLPSTARILDIGTGSGCLAVTLAAERPTWRVVGMDRSLAALLVARTNARRWAPAVRLVAGDLAEAVSGAWDLVTANLPYLPSDERLRLSVEVRHDPWLALDGGHDGLDLVRRLVVELPRLLAPGGWALLELGENQADAVGAAARANGLAELGRVRDLGAIDRVVQLHRPA